MAAIVRGALVLLGMVATAFVGTVVLLPLGLPFILAGGAGWGVFHWWTDTVKEQWLSLASVLIYAIGGTKVVLYGELPRPGQRSFIISNHRTSIDWMMLWGALLRFPGSALRHLRIVLRQDLKRLPAFGWAMSTFRFIFLSRSWETDRRDLQTFCRHYTNFEDGASFLVFPEGTDLSASNLKRAHAFAESKGLPKLEHVMYPKATGSLFLMEQFKSKLDCFVDITMGYKDCKEGERPSEILLAKGRFPKEVHVLVETVKFSDIPLDPTEFSEHLRKLFLAKNDRIAAFYKNGHRFDAKPLDSSLSPVKVGVCIAYWLAAVAATVWLMSCWTGCAILLASLASNTAFGAGIDTFVYSVGAKQSKKLQ